MALQALTLQQLVEQQYGVKVDVKSSNIVLTSTPQRLADNNPNRVGLLIVNLGSQTAYINWSSSVSATAGINLPVSGGTFSMNWKDDFNIVGYEMYGIAAASTTAVAIFEIYTVGQAPQS